MKQPLFIFLLAFAAISLYSQQNPRVAVVPFNAIGVSANEALVITGLFETALVKTESFNVIEQNQIAAILDAQAYTLTGCTDETCAIEMGKLLAAEQIIIGDLSAIGGKVILNVKIIDVAEGRNIKADKVDAQGMGDMTAAVELLAFKLAGLTLVTGAKVEIATDFIELLIETEPTGADILINGIPKGISPNLISRIPLGNISVEARKDNFYAVKNIEVNKNTSRLFLSLEEQFGKLFLKSSETNINVFLDGRDLGSFGAGLFNHLSLGTHELEVMGNSLYWSGTIEIFSDTTTRTDVYPKPYGSLKYLIPEGAVAKLSTPGYEEVLTGSGNIPRLWTGRYSLSVMGENYLTHQEDILISQGQKIDLQLELEFTSEYIAYLKEKTKQEDYSRFTKEIILLRGIVSSYISMDDNHISRLDTFIQEVEESGWDFSEFILEGKAILSGVKEIKKNQEKLAVLYEEKNALESKIGKIKSRQGMHKLGGWISVGAGAVSALASATFFFMANSAYEDYTTAGPDDWESLKGTYETYDTITISALIAAALGGAAAPVIWLTSPDDEATSGLNAQIARVTMEIRDIEGVLQ